MITEQQLALYKYQKQSQYFRQPMADIVIHLFQSEDCNDILQFISNFYHRLINVEKNIWEVKFPDDSVILIKENESGVYIKCLQSIDYSHIDGYFI